MSPISVESPAFANQASTFGAEQTRRAVFLPFSAAGGVKASGDLAVTAPVSGMTCNVATGEILVPGSSSAIQGLYYGRVSSTSNLAVAASNPSNPRIDMVYAAITDAAYTGATNTFVVAVATGTPTVGATLVNLTGAPALPTSAIILAYILVPATSTSVTTPNISDQRVRFVVSNAASLVSSSTQAFTGNVSAPAYIATGLTGAIAASRYVGATASGAPVTGTFAVGDFVVDQTGKVWVCTTLGSPGTWTQVGASSGAFTQIAQTVLGSDTASIDFTSIAGTYNHLMLLVEARTDVAAAGDSVKVTLNADVTNYAGVWQYSTTTVVTTSAAPTTHIELPAAGATATAGFAGGSQLMIYDYARTTFHKRVSHVGGSPVYLVVGAESLKATAAITRVTVAPLGGTVLKAGSMASLYGLT